MFTLRFPFCAVFITVSDLPRLYTAVEVAKHLRLNPRTVMRMARAGELPGKKIGRNWLFHQNFIDSLFSAGVASVPVLERAESNLSSR